MLMMLFELKGNSTRSRAVWTSNLTLSYFVLYEIFSVCQTSNLGFLAEILFFLNYEQFSSLNGRT